MGLVDQKILLLCTDKALSSSIRSVVESSVKNIVSVTSHAQAVTRLQQSAFDGVIIHDLQTPLNDPKGALAFCFKAKGAHEKTRFFVLGAETPALAEARKIPTLSVIDDATDIAALLKALSEIFSQTVAPPAAKAAPAPATEGSSQPQVDMQVLAPLLAAALEFLKEASGGEPNRESPFVALPSGQKAPFSLGLGLQLDFELDKSVGAFALHVDPALALKLGQLVTRTQMSELNDTARQALLRNWQGLAEKAHGELRKAGKNFSARKTQLLSDVGGKLPVIIEAPRLCLPFRVKNGAFLIDCGCKST